MSEQIPAPDDAAQGGPVGAESFAPEPETVPGAEPGVLFDETVTEQQVVVQRQPRVWRFMLLGGVVFALAALIVTYAMPYDPATATYDRNIVAGFVLLFAAAFGLMLGGLLAVLAQRIARRGAVTLTAEHIEGRFRD